MSQKKNKRVLKEVENISFALNANFADVDLEQSAIEKNIIEENVIEENVREENTRAENVNEGGVGEKTDEPQMTDWETKDAGLDFAVEAEPVSDMTGTELEAFESAEIEDVEKISEEKLVSVLESLLFATDRPMSLNLLKAAFQGTGIRVADIRRGLERLQLEYANPLRGVSLEEVAGGYQLRTKLDNQVYLQRTVKARPFKLSGPALEVLSIVAYKQPSTKAAVDEIRGVESGHLMRGLLDRGLIKFAGKSELPGRPMLYETTRRFLEIFGLRNINELPTLNEIDQLIPEGIGEAGDGLGEKQTLSDLSGELSSEVVAKSYSENEEELVEIASELQTISTSTDFFEDEKRRQKEKRDLDRAQDIIERLAIGETVDERDRRWLAKHEMEKEKAAEPPDNVAAVVVQASDEPVDGKQVRANDETEAIVDSEAAVNFVAEVGVGTDNANEVMVEPSESNS